MKIIYRGILLAVAALAGCEKDETFLRTTPGAIEIAADVLEAGLLVEATASWLVWEEVEWLGCRYDGDALWITIAEANPNPEERTGVITIVSGDGKSIDVPVTQLGNPDQPQEPEPEPEPGEEPEEDEPQTEPGS